MTIWYLLVFIAVVALAVQLGLSAHRHNARRELVATTIECPFCAERVLPRAIICPYCREDISDPDETPTATS
jgi:uncharacterized OB-fold protein